MTGGPSADDRQESVAADPLAMEVPLPPPPVDPSEPGPEAALGLGAWRPQVWDPKWNTETVQALWDGIVLAKARDRLPILADALEEAGCDNTRFLTRLRGEAFGAMPLAVYYPGPLPSDIEQFARCLTLAGSIETVDGHQAVVGTVSVNDRQLDTLLSEGSFNKTRRDQIAYAEKLGYRMATRAETRAYVEDLLAKEDNNTINEAEKNALKTYRERYVRDTEGRLAVDGRRVYAFGRVWDDGGNPRVGALFVRASAESK